MTPTRRSARLAVASSSRVRTPYADWLGASHGGPTRSASEQPQRPVRRCGTGPEGEADRHGDEERRRDARPAAPRRPDQHGQGHVPAASSTSRPGPDGGGARAASSTTPKPTRPARPADRRRRLAGHRLPTCRRTDDLDHDQPSPAAIAKSLTVPVGFAASESGATFTCSLDGAAVRRVHQPRPSSRSHRVTTSSGWRDTDAAGNADATPAEQAFTAYDCVTLKADVVHDRTKVRAAEEGAARRRGPTCGLPSGWPRRGPGAAACRRRCTAWRRSGRPHARSSKAARAAYAPCLL